MSQELNNFSDTVNPDQSGEAGTQTKSKSPDMSTATIVECPICHDNYDHPKILPCGHVVCRECVLSWLWTGNGDQNGCPLCRVPIISSNNTKKSSQLTEVDSFPTDLATEMEVVSKFTLEPHQCSLCDALGATLFCLQCSIKLCLACSSIHKKSLSSSEHVTEQLSKLSAEQLASKRQRSCPVHNQRLLKLFCTGHEELACVMCVHSEHRYCPMTELKTIKNAALATREEVASLAQKLEDRKAEVIDKTIQLHKQSLDATAMFSAARSEVNAACDELQSFVEMQRLRLHDEIEEHEDKYLEQLGSCGKHLIYLGNAMTAHTKKAEGLVASAPDVALLGMLKGFRERLVRLQFDPMHDPPSSIPGCVLMMPAVNMAKQALAAIGLKTSQQIDQNGSPLNGPEFDVVVNVGDRVQRGRDWSPNRGNQDGPAPGLGTVVSSADDAIPEEYVFVRWDHSDITYVYSMGINGRYELQLATEQ